MFSARPGSNPPPLCIACNNRRSSPASNPITCISSLSPNQCCVIALRNATRTTAVNSAGSFCSGACSASASNMVLISRIGTCSANRFCNTLCNTVNDSISGIIFSVIFGSSLLTLSNSICASWRPNNSDAYWLST